MIRLEKEGQLQISFAWLFAIIVGAVILIIAIYGTTRLGETGEEASTAKAGKEISVLLNPLETSFESGTSVPLTLSVETRIHNGCSATGNFGGQDISVSQLSFGEFTDSGIEAVSRNKYVFSDSVVQGEDFFLFSKPFEFPFKIADLIYLTSAEKKYCFVDPGEKIENELENLNQGNLFVDECPEGSIKICFDSGEECDIRVNENSRAVQKRGNLLYYEEDEANALMFAAIFSEKGVYECQVQRLMQRGEQLSLVYNDKASILSSRGCANPDINVLGLGSSFSQITDSSQLISVSALVGDVDRINDRLVCRLW